MKYLSEVQGQGGIYAKCVAASIANGIPIYTLETKAPKFIDAECLTGDTLLHFERQAKPGQQCLATMSIEEFYDKWTNGITKVSKLGKEFTNKYKNILKKMRLRCYDFTTEKYTTTSVLDIWKSGVKKVYKITSGDFDIEASENHYFLTQRGWIQVKDLRLNDSLVRISHRGKKETPKNYLSFNRAIKEELLELQDFKCKDCSCSINKSCDVHHIVPVTVKPELWNDKNNVVALCIECHINRHIELGYTSLSPTLSGITSIEYSGEKLTYDLQVEHEDSNFVANGFVVHNCEKHRMLSSNSSSSRAIPFGKNLVDIYYNLVSIRKKEKGMQGYEEIDESWKFKDDISQLFEHTYKQIEYWKDTIHKQHLNRYLEPWMFQKKVVTATEWDNFFNLRLAKDAQPEIQELARCMKAAIDVVTPTELKLGEWHLPYTNEYEAYEFFDGETWHYPQLSLSQRQKCSVARCARVSYYNLDFTTTNIDTDEDLYFKLFNAKHLTPFEHQATPIDPNTNWKDVEGITHITKANEAWSANFRGWIQYRHLVD